MHWRVVLQLVALINLALGVSMAAPLAFGVSLGEGDVLAFGLAMAATLAVNGPVFLACRRAEAAIGHREGMLVVTLGWFSACIFAALPFYFYGLLSGNAEFSLFTNAVFESASGLTTTGATILSAIETLPHGILWWRSIIQWYGGMGIIVFSLALLPKLGVGGMQLYRAEVPGPVADKATPRIQDTARLLWQTYVVISAAQVLLLVLAGMGVFDAFCHTFTTMATGGFSTRNAGIMAFAHQPQILIVLIVFMFIAGANFGLNVAFLVNRKFTAHVRDPEFRVYTILTLAMAAIIAVFLLAKGLMDSVSDAVLHSLFNVVTIMTTTGYNSTDFEAWNTVVPVSGFLLFTAMFLGGMSGSTGGGIKTMRVWLLTKTALRELKRLVHPHGVFKVRAGERTVAEPVIAEMAGFFILYLFIYFLGVVVVSLDRVDFVTASTTVASCIGNVGPGLGRVGPTDNYGFYASWVKWFLSLLMVVGRLELYTVLVLLVPAFWKR